MEPFKNFLSPAVAKQIAAALVRAHPTADADAFCRQILPQLEALEMKARAALIAAALHDALPPAPDQRAAILLDMLHPDESGPGPADDQGLRGWALWPLTIVVEQHGLVAFDGSLALLREMTKRFTSEFAVRPFLVADQARALDILTGWLNDPNPHVRRLISEGTRPRLPWGLRLKALVSDPTPCLPLLEALRDDPSEYVRRSVANHLNDIAKDHPALVSDLARQWMCDAPPLRRALLRHACRGLIKAGDEATLAVFGQHPPQLATGALTLERDRVAMGDALGFSMDLRSTADHDQNLTIDYVLHLRKADGSLRPKVFKGTTLMLAPGASYMFSRRHVFRPVTTRRHYGGLHALCLRINGTDTAVASFTLLA